MRKLKVLLACLIIGMGVVLAQNTISGRVISAEDGEPVIGATIVVKGTTTGTITNLGGDFSITVPSNNRILVISYVGMKTVEVAAIQNMVVRLESDASELDEILVVAYGTTSRRSFTGAASVVRGETLSRGNTSNITKSLEGTVPGVQIASSSGQPGSSAAIRIRGLGSISANQAPLIIVDGVPYAGSLNTISPHDIETLNVLKDAAANSMYGARGSNGVILITTKRGQKGATKVSFDSRFGVNSRGVPAYNVITSQGDYYEMMFEAIRNNLVAGGMGYYPASREVANTLIPNYLGYNVFAGIPDDKLIDPITGRLNPAANQLKWNDSWLKDPFVNGVKQEYNVNVSGGDENTSAFMSASYLNDRGYVVNSDFSRLSTRVKIDQKVNNNIKVGINVAYAKTTSNTPVESTGGTQFSNIFNFSQNVAPIYPIYKYDLATGAPILNSKGVQLYDFGSGNFSNGIPTGQTRAYAGEQNPMYKLSYDSNLGIYDNLSTRFYTEIKFLNNFTFTANMAYDVFNTHITDFINPLQGDGKTYNGIGYKTSQRVETLNLNQLLNYSKKSGLHQINILLGHESKSDDLWFLEGSKTNFFDPFNPELANAGAVNSLTSHTTQYRLEGYLSRAEYSYTDRYYFSGSFRRDASSKFAPDVRWGNFWSLGASWRIKEEDFLRDIDAVTNLRLKASYGTQGNDGIPGMLLYIDQYTLVSDGVNASPILTLRGAPGLTWEKSNNFNAGFELGLFNRATINADFFVKETKDMIYRRPLSPSGGSPTWIWDNQIDMRNIGVELEMNVDLINRRDLRWGTSLNLTAYKNEITKVPDDKDPNGYIAGDYWRKVGGSLYDFYTYDFAGVNRQNGKSLWYRDVVSMVNGKEVLNRETTEIYAEATRYETGKSAIPDFYGGFSTNILYKGFDAGIQTAFQVGGWVYDSQYAGQMSGGEAGSNWNKDIYKRWTPTNTLTSVPKVQTGDQNINAFSTRFLTSASYLNIRNISIGYTLPRHFISALHIESMRFYASADNVLLITARQGLDSRHTFTGTIYEGAYSALRTTSVGVTVQF